MKKIMFTIISLVAFLLKTNAVIGGGYDYSFSLDYEGTIIVNEQKYATVTLQGVDAPIHNNVRIKVDITGPTTPTILATDSNGNEYDIANIGYWGAETGFVVGGTFTNVTPIKATFSEIGTYNVTLTLIDVNDPAAEYAKETFTMTVVAKEVVGEENQDTNLNDELTDGDEELGELTELPQTGNFNYIYIISISLIGIIGTLIYFSKIRTNNN